MPKFTKNHGNQIVLDYRRNKFWGKVKSLFTVAFWKGMFFSSIGIFLVAGFFSANALVGFTL